MGKALKKPSGISAKDWNLPYKPVAFDPAVALKRDLKNPAFRAMWEALQGEFATLDVLLDARRCTGRCIRRP